MSDQLFYTKIIAVVGSVSLFISLLTGIPRIVSLYSGFLSGVTTVIPLDLVSVWFGRLGLFLIGVLIGWYGHIRHTSINIQSVDSIEGCVEVRDVLWKGAAKITDGEDYNISIPDEPLCIDCQSPMNRQETKGNAIDQARARNSSVFGSGTKTRYLWACPSSSCGKTVIRDFDRDDEAFSLFSKHFDRIVKSQDEEYSLGALIKKAEETDQDVTPRGIWKIYVDSVDDPDVSTLCF